MAITGGGPAGLPGAAIAVAGRRRIDRLTAACAAVAVVLLTLMAFEIGQATEAARRGVEERQASRVSLAREFLDTYIADVLTRTRATAAVVLSGPEPTGADLAAAAQQMSFPTALLLDGDGDAVAAVPANPSMIGRRLGDELPNLRVARQGRANVSNVVVSVSTGEPIVAFAVPFPTPYGTRVLSGGYAITRTPLGAFLRSFSTIAGNAVYLVDPGDRIVAANDPARSGSLPDHDPDLAAAKPTAWSGRYARDGEDRFFASEDVDAAPWRLIATVPTDGLYASVDRNGLPWIMFATVAVAALLCVLLVSRVSGQRRQLAAIAEVDAFTGLHNRRHVDRLLRDRYPGTPESRSSGPALGVFLIDVDHFKQINDRHGHQRGDETLVAIARVLRSCVRPTDTVARWGGEEFMVLAPDADAGDAALLAERLRRSVADGVEVDGRPVTVSIGYTTRADQQLDAVTSRADIALYRAKAEGRNRSATLDGDHDGEGTGLTVASPT